MHAVGDRTPLVPVGVPVHTAEGFVGAAVESLLAQEEGDVEVVVSDNDSTDDAEDLCRALAAQDRQVRYVRQHCSESDRVYLAEVAVRGRLVDVPQKLFHRRRHSGRPVRTHPSARERIARFDPEQVVARTSADLATGRASCHRPVPSGARS